MPAVTWSRVGGMLPSGRHNTSHYGTQLTIWNVSLSDSGVYECHGRNSHNTAHHRISLNVEGRYALHIITTLYTVFRIKRYICFLAIPPSVVDLFIKIFLQM